MNRPIRTLAVGCLLLFAALLINANYVQVIKANDLNDAAANKRARDAECSRERGPILVGGEPVARSVPSNDSLQFQRRYTNWPMYANLTGYFSCIYGTTGIENTENSLLSGSDERLFVNRMIDLVGNDQPKGGSVTLTIDPKAQQAALSGLQDLQAQYGPTKGAVVALDPTSGAILAMVTQPSYNPNLIASHDPTLAKRAFESVVNDPDDRGLNRAAQLTYPPGSTFKLVTASAALSNGYTPESTVKGGTVFDLPGSSDTIKNENGSDCGGSEISLTTALEVSCNVAFADLGVKLGAETLQEQAEKYGFNDDILDELPSAESVYPDANDLDEAQTALTAIGQYDDRGHALADGDGRGRHRQRRRRDEALHRAERPRPQRPADPRRGQPRGAAPGRLRVRRRPADPDDGRRRRQRHRHERPDPERLRRRQDRYRQLRGGQGALRVDGHLRTGRRPAGRRRRAGRADRCRS